jgi:YhcH/YjgK/YiaL family protein
MILDALDNCGTYAAIHPRLGPALAGLRDIPLADLPVGRHPVDGDRVYVVVAAGDGKAAGEVKLEAHRSYVDVHVVLEGEDTIGWKPASMCTRLAAAYDTERDFLLYDDTPELWITLRPGLFGVFLPEDAHAPMVSRGRIRKAVVKVAVNNT